jgi:FtsH-binding integral membrane protein
MTTGGYPGVIVATAGVEERRTYLRRVLGIALFGLVVAGGVGIASMLFIATHTSVLRGWGPMLIILGCWAITNFVAQPMVFGERKWAGFMLGTMTQGVALGFLLLVAVLASRQDFGNPLTFIGMAIVLTVVAGVGITTYVLAEPRELSLLRAGLMATFLPMLLLMGVTFAFPNLLGGTGGIVVAAIFVLVSAGGLLYQLNLVVHRFRTNMQVEGGYVIAIGVIVLFWNILSLLLRMRRR